MVSEDFSYLKCSVILSLLNGFIVGEWLSLTLVTEAVQSSVLETCPSTQFPPPSYCTFGHQRRKVGDIEHFGILPFHNTGHHRPLLLPSSFADRTCGVASDRTMSCQFSVPTPTAGSSSGPKHSDRGCLWVCPGAGGFTPSGWAVKQGPQESIPCPSPQGFLRL